MTWRPFKAKDPEPVDVGRIDVRIVLDDGTQYPLMFSGKFCDSGWHVYAADRFEYFMKRSTELGTYRVRDGHYIPIHRVREIFTESTPLLRKAGAL